MDELSVSQHKSLNNVLMVSCLKKLFEHLNFNVQTTKNKIFIFFRRKKNEPCSFYLLILQSS